MSFLGRMKLNYSFVKLEQEKKILVHEEPFLYASPRSPEF